MSDSPYPKEAFSIGDAEDTENAVEGAAEDLDECKVYEGKLCHQVCVNTQGSYRCACLPGHTLQQDGRHCVPGEMPAEMPISVSLHRELTQGRDSAHSAH